MDEKNIKRRKQYVYDFLECAPKAKTIDLWLNKYKHRETTMLEVYKKFFLDVELQPKHRHRRSIAVRSLRRLYGFTVTDLLLPIEFPKRFSHPHGIGYKQFMGRRLYIY